MIVEPDAEQVEDLALVPESGVVDAADRGQRLPDFIWTRICTRDGAS